LTFLTSFKDLELANLAIFLQMRPSPFICIKSIHQINSLHDYIIIHGKKNSSRELRGLWPQKKAKPRGYWF
jgi:hypothetical protein